MKNHYLFEGENLEFLRIAKSNKKEYDLVYIDPPYNTENKSLKYSDKKPEEEWLSFVSKRLDGLMSLVKKTGCVLLSINDQNVNILRSLCDKLFPNQYVTTFIWHKKRSGGGDSKHAVEEHEYILCYAKDPESLVFRGVALSEEQIEEYKVDENGNKYKLETLLLRGPNATVEKRPNLCYKIKDPDGNEVSPREGKGTWRYKEKTYFEELEKGNVVWRNTPKGYRAYTKTYINKKDGSEKRIKLRTILDKDYGIGETREGTEEVTEMLGKHSFVYPKPISLMSFLIDSICQNDADVLDFFAGSGTTGHAVLLLNKKDGGSRSFTLCTNNENDICQKVTYPRLLKAINGYVGISGKHHEKLGGEIIYSVLQN